MAGIKTLVVEDDAMQSKLVTFLLQEAGHVVQAAPSAELAMELLQTFSPDLILMDIQLPGRDGLELTSQLRGEPVHARTTIVAFTAYTDPYTLASIRESRCDGYISKPIDTALFARQVRNFITGAAGEGSVSSDSGDLMAQSRNAFLGEGLEQCGWLLKDLKSNPGFAGGKLTRQLYRWAAVANDLGFSEISSLARRVHALTVSGGLEEHDLVQSMESMRSRFLSATLFQAEPALALAGCLRNVRIGLVNFTEEGARRLQIAADRSNTGAAIERMNAESGALTIRENRTDYGALVIDECSLSTDAVRHLPQWPIPAIYIGSRSTLDSLSQLSRRAQDFVIAPWDAEDVLLRLHRLIAKTAPATAPIAADSVRPQITGGGKRKRPRILIADDDPELVSLVIETLGEAGADCEIARSGQQALDIAARHRPDAIVLDVNMAGLDGFEVLKRLRHNVATEWIPVLLLTARSQESDIAQGVGSGASDYVVKPFDPADLANRVAKIIEARSLLAAR
jgi:DNA-binding response OmpR family regulator